MHWKNQYGEYLCMCGPTAGRRAKPYSVLMCCLGRQVVGASLQKPEAMDGLARPAVRFIRDMVVSQN